MFFVQKRFMVGLLVVSGCLSASCTIASPSFFAKRPPVKIMPLGDSITQGSKAHGSYRRALWKLLKTQGYGVDFVGSQKTVQDGESPLKDFDLDHEGHWGWRVDEVLAQLDGWVKTTKPDIALIHLGTNDIAQQQDIRETIAELKQVVVQLRRTNPKIKVLMAQIIPLQGSEKRCQAFNAQIKVLSRQLSTKQSPIIAVDQFTGFQAEPGKDTYDGTHPNALGEKKMAQRWFNAIKSLL
jgi:lysophospholipase L1-like esterase